MALHPVARQLLDEAAASDQPNSHLLPLAVARANFESLFASLQVEQIAAVENQVAVIDHHEIPVRIYRPVGAVSSALVIYLHGGGWQMGSLDSHDGICRSLANASGCTLLSVDYRKPPEHKFPAAPDDCY